MNKRPLRLWVMCLGLAGAVGAAALAGSPQGPTPEEYRERSRQWSARMEANGLPAMFTGVTTDGDVVPDLFEVRSTGVSMPWCTTRDLGQ